MVRVLHIGPVGTPHVCDVIEQIKKYTDFHNAVLSPKPEMYMPKDFFSDVPVYVYNYLDFLDNAKMHSFVNSVLETEKPDIIIGHSFSQVAIVLNYALTVRLLPAMAFIWGYTDCVKNFSNELFKKIYFDNLRVLSKINFLLTTNPYLIGEGVRGYRISQEDFAGACPPVNLAQYTDHIPDVSAPRLLLGKARCEKYIYASLPIAFKQFPKLEVHAFRNPIGISLAKQVGVAKRVRFHPYPLYQESFANLIKKCNIVHTITPDPGTGGTAVQASYAGCVNLMRRCVSSKGMIEDQKNAIMCNMNVQDVTSKLLYSIKYLPQLCKRFKENNKHLLIYDRENTWKVFYKAMMDCLDGKKGKIVPR